MTFPRKKPHQRIKGYVLSVFDLIEQEHASGIPMTEIHKNLCREAGYESAYSTFANARAAVKKMRSMSLEPSMEKEKRLPEATRIRENPDEKDASEDDRSELSPKEKRERLADRYIKTESNQLLNQILKGKK